MERYDRVKILLKKWEKSFTEENQRKPNKDDIERAPEEVKKLYGEYRALKEEASADTSREPEETLERQAPSKNFDTWGTHLNRKNMPAPSPKLTPKDRESLHASVQYFGMKLKANLGALLKDKPVSLKKSFTPGRAPMKSWKEGPHQSVAADTEPALPRPADTCPRPCVTPAEASCAEESDELFDMLPAFTLSKRHPSTSGTPDALAERAVRLRCSVTERLSSVDGGWLKRCQVFDEVENGEEPATGNLSSPLGKTAVLPGGTSGNTGAASSLVTPSAQDDATPLRETVAKTAQKPPPLPLPPGDKLQMSRVTSPAETACSRASGCGSPLKATTRETVDEETRQGPKGGALGDSKVTPPVRSAKKSRSKSSKCEEGGGKSLASCQSEGHSGGTEGKEAKRRSRKRLRESDAKGEQFEEGGEELEKTSTKKKRRVRNGSVECSRAPQSKRKKVKATEDDGTDLEDPNSLEKIKKQKMPQENLLGEVDEEEVHSVSTRPKNPVKLRGMKNIDGNFVKINLKKKSHVKGFALRGAALRKQMYVQKFMLKGERFGGGLGRGRGRFGSLARQNDSCFKCGGIGHWAQDCYGKAPTPQVDDSAVEEEPFELPTLEEVARATGTLRCEQPDVPTCNGEGKEIENDSGEILLNVIRPNYEKPTPPPPMKPLYDLAEDGKVKAATPEVYEALADFGYKAFRPGQEVAIMRILSGLSTLVVLSTGMGKSLCYQLPAYLYAKQSKSIALVVSPLVSLMDDQVKAGQVHVLLLSPEALVGGGRAGSGCLPPADQLPPVAFACIDEAHCVSEWSHNFRPCYLRLCKVLRDRLGVRCLLGLTATATLSTALDIARHLEIGDKEGIAVRSAAIPSNLQLSVSMDRDKNQALVSLLKGERFGSLESVIVYCTRREETVRIAALLRTCLQGVMLRESSRALHEESEQNPVGKRKKALAMRKIRKPLKWIAESYHAGMSASERRRVQNNFMCGELRVVVATVAFGMGLDKSDVRGIIHYNMPKSFESYVQEIGRAGRDSEPAHCHLFLDPEAMEVDDTELLELMETSDMQLEQRPQEEVSVEKVNVEEEGHSDDHQVHGHYGKFEGQAPEVKRVETTGQLQNGELEEVTGQDQEDWKQEEAQQTGSTPASRVCHTHERAIPIQETVEALDITEEGLETLLCYLELHPQKWVELMHPTQSACRLVCYGGPQQLRKLTKICPPVAVVLARKRMAGERVEVCDSLEFDVVELADTMGWELPLVKRGLRQLQWSTERGPFGGTGRSGVLVEFSNLSLYFRSYGDLTADEMDDVCEFLHQRVIAQEKTQLCQLKACFKAFRSVAYQNCSFCTDERDEDRSLKLKALLKDYFDKKMDFDLSKNLQKDREAEDAEEYEELNVVKMKDWEDQIRADIRSFLSSRSDEKFSGRAVARIFHGIGSPCYPAQVFGRDRRFWRRYIQFDFNEIIRLATQEIIRTK
ncbi:ATP-dependent DNA helicase Q4-like [Scleropages formosus]|uniref:DNA 3'-5' helicase n=1 Tax=Scleropages formosus TaxID=113540 RepID=A0A0P7YUL3_SCLFO|nr:ATP-dependent DNA helicase Q4-like [Scleropages formosus]